MEDKMKKKLCFLFFVLFVVALNGRLVEKTFHFEEPSITHKDSYDYIEMLDCFEMNEPQKPVVPMKPVRLLLPSEEQAISVEVIGFKKQIIGQNYKLYPGQYETHTSQSHLYKFTEPDIELYSSNKVYPEVVNSPVETNYYRGHSIAILNLYPVQYIPAKGELSYFTEMKVKIRTSSTTEASKAYTDLYRSDEKTRNTIREFVQNPENLDLYPIQNITREDYDINLLIITTDYFENDLTEFVKFKKLQGYNTLIVTVEDIYSTYTGYDDQDEIRLCIRDYYQNNGTEYVILAGDVEDIPHRGLFGHYWANADPEPIHYSDDDVPADMYYAALDRVGTGSGPDWNVDNDSMWGEYDVNDPDFGDITEADFLSEVFIGRICADSSSEFANALNKQIMYQKTPVESDNKKGIMVGEKMWDGWCGDEHKEQIRLGGSYEGYTTAGLVDDGFTCQLQYAHTYPDSSWPVADLINKMNAGTNVMNHLGHGNVGSYMGFRVDNNSVEQLTSDGTNHNFYFVYSQTCYGSSFDNRLTDGTYYSYDCMTEKFTTHEKGVLGVVGNSRFGLVGSGQHFDRYFFHAMCKSSNPIYQLGRMQEYSKYNSGHSNSALRWQYYELNLFGDPTLKIWPTDNLNDINYVNVITYPSIGMDHLDVVVNPAIAGLRVSAYTESGTFGTGLTNSSGFVSIDFNQPVNSEEIIYCMVTSDYYLPYTFEAGWLPYIWEGDVSNNWNDPDNWYSNDVPGSSDDVTIPAGTTYSPKIYQYNAFCNELTIESGAQLTIQGKSLSAYDYASIAGELVMNQDNSVLNVYGTLSWHNGSSVDISADGALINCLSHFAFSYGADVQMDKGLIKLIGSSDAVISCYDDDSYVNDLEIDKNTAQVEISGELVDPFVIGGNLIIGANSTVVNEYETNDIVLKGDLTCNGNLWLNHATFFFSGILQEINSFAGDHFNNLEINSSALVEMNCDISIQGDLTIDPGGLKSNGYDIDITGDWTNNIGPLLGFLESTGSVTFNGTSDQYCYGETFNDLILQKSSGKLIIPSGANVICDSYNWNSGMLQVQGGQFEALDLADNSIVGTYILNNGQIDLHQDASHYPDVNGSIIIYNGEFNIHGGADDCYFAHTYDTYLYMEGGTLDVKDWGIHFDDLHLFSHVITGGTIKMNGSFSSDRHDFDPSGGTVLLYGSDDVDLDFGWGNTFHNITIDKTLSDNSARNKNTPAEPVPTSRRNSRSTENTRSGYANLQEDLELNGTLDVNGGVFDLNGHSVDANKVEIAGTLKMSDPADLLEVTTDVIWQDGSYDLISAGEIKLGRDWRFEEGTNATLGTGNTVRFIGSNISEIFINEFDNAKFGNVILDKSGGYTTREMYYSAYMVVDGDLALNADNEFRADNLELNGELYIDNNAEFKSDYGLIEINADVESNGLIEIFGGMFRTNEDFQLNSNGVLTIDGGDFISHKSYTGNYLTFAGTLNLLEGQFVIWNENVRFTTNPNIDNADIYLGRGLQATVANAFQPNGGSVQFIGSQWSNIEVTNGNYFHDLVISKSETLRGCMLYGDLVVNNDLGVYGGKLMGYANEITVNNSVTIGTGGFIDPDDGLLKVGGDWSNQRGAVGFAEGNGTVRFINDSDSYLLTDETFYNLEIDKNGSQFTYLFIDDGITVTVENDVDINDCSLRLSPNSTLNIENDLVISEDTNLYACLSDPSFINISGNWSNQNTTGYPWDYGFVEGLSTVTFNGTDNQTVTAMHGSMDFYNVVVDNSGTNPDYDCVILNGDAKVLGDFTVIDGTWKDADVTTQEFYGDFEVASGGWWVPQGHIKFMGTGDHTYHKTGSVVFRDVTINKTLSDNTRAASLTMLSDMYALNDGSLVVENGTLDLNGSNFICDTDVSVNSGGILEVDAGAILKIGDDAELNVNSGGMLRVYGSDGDEAKITRKSSGHYYDLTIQSGGAIDAEYGIFEYMATDGVYVKNGAAIGDGNTGFNNCLFWKGISGGSLLRIENDQDLLISNTEFDNNSSSMYNVYKSFNLGHLELVGAFGDFAGSSYEYDPHNRVDWTLAPDIAVSPDSLSFGDVAVGQTSTLDFTIENTGGGTLTGLLLSPAGFTVGSYSDNSKKPLSNTDNTITYSVEGGNTNWYYVTFEPDTVQTFAGNVVITHNAGGSNEYLPVEGNGIQPPPPEIDVSPDSLIYGDIIVDQDSTEWLNIFNAGGQALVGNISTPYGYTISEFGRTENGEKYFTGNSTSQNGRNTLSFNIPGDDLMDYQVMFHPDQRQNYDGTITITHNASGPDETVVLIGSGVGAGLDVDPLYFEENLLTGQTSTQTMTVSNIGNLELDYLAYARYSTMIRDSILSSSFETYVPPYGWSTQVISGYGTWSQACWGAHSGSCAAEASPWSLDDARLITPYFTATDDCILTYWIKQNDIYSTGGDFAVEVSTDSLNWTTIDNYSQDELSDHYQRKFLSLASYSGQSILIAFRAYNNSYAHGVFLDDVQIVGDPSPDYTWLSFDGNAVTQGSIPVGGAADQIDLGFDATGLPDGEYMADIMFMSNDPQLANMSVPVSFIVGTPGISLDPNTIDFGDLAVGASSDSSLTITNTGWGDLEGEMDIPAGYNVYELVENTGNSPRRFIREKLGANRDTLSFSISSGMSRYYIVSFAPDAPQSYDGSIVITHNAPGGSDDLDLTGSGIAADLVHSPDSLSALIREDSSATEIFTIDNVGNIDLNYQAYVQYPDADTLTLEETSFEDSLVVTGWTTEIISGSGDWEQSSLYPHWGSLCAEANYWEVEDARLISPVFTATYDCELSYWIRSYDPPYYGGSFGIEVSTDGTTWTFIDTCGQNSYSQSYIEETQYLASYYGQDIQIAFRVFNNLWGNGICIDDVEITGSESSYLWLSLDGSDFLMDTLSPGAASHDIDVEFDGTGLAEGIYFANIILNSNDYQQPAENINVTLTIGTPSISILPSSIDFGEVIVGNDSTSYFTIENLGTMPLSGSITSPVGYTVTESITEKSIKSKDRSQRNVLAYNIDSGYIQTFDVNFQPLNAQTYNGNIIITHNASGSDELIALTGSGVSEPVVMTYSANNISSTTATSGGIVISNGGYAVTARGVCWNTTGDPDLADDHTTNGTGLGEFTSNLTNLIPNTSYYVRAYATNSLGTGYGMEITFTTFTPQIFVSTSSLPDFGDVEVGTYSTVQYYTVSGEYLIDDITIDAPADFEISLTTESDEIVNKKGNNRDFASQIILSPTAGSIPTTTIYVRFNPSTQSTYSGDISHGSTSAVTENVAVSGTGITLPIVTTATLSNITSTTAIGGGEVTGDGGSSVIARGVCWNTTGDPDLTDDHTTDGSEIGTFTSDLTDLTPDTFYYVRAYATNDVGTIYGNELTFTTNAVLPPSAPANLTIDISGGNIILNWDSVSDADSYKVYSSTDPGAVMENWDFEAEVTSTTWSEAVSAEKKFYCITAVKAD